jgi:hypothetical protein
MFITGDMIIIHTCTDMHAIQRGDPFGSNTKPVRDCLTRFNRKQVRSRRCDGSHRSILIHSR